MRAWVRTAPTARGGTASARAPAGLLAFAIAAFAAAAIGCNDRGAPAESAAAALIDRDAPYVFVSGEPLPAGLAARIAPVVEIVQQLDEADGTGADAARETARALVRRWITGDTASIGIARGAPYVVYGHGAVPILRSQVADRAKLAAAITSLEAALGPAQLRERDALHAVYRFELGQPDVILLVVLREAVVSASIAPAVGEDELLDHLEATAAADATGGLLHELARLRRELAAERDALGADGLGRHGIGRIRLAAMVTRGMELDGGYSPPCIREIGAVLSHSPDLAVGLDAGPNETVTLRAVMGVDDDARTLLSGLIAAAPDADVTDDAALALAVGLAPERVLSALGRLDRRIGSPAVCGSALPLEGRGSTSLAIAVASAGLAASGSPGGVGVALRADSSLRSPRALSRSPSLVAVTDVAVAGAAIALASRMAPELRGLEPRGEPREIDVRSSQLGARLGLARAWVAASARRIAGVAGSQPDPAALLATLSAGPRPDGTVLHVRARPALVALARSDLGSRVGSRAAAVPPGAAGAAAASGEERARDAARKLAVLVRHLDLGIRLTDAGLELEAALAFSASTPPARD